MKQITPHGTTTIEESFITKLAIKMAQEQNQFRVEDFKPIKHSPNYTVQLKKIGLLNKELLPEGVTEEWWTTPEVAQKIQTF